MRRLLFTLLLMLASAGSAAAQAQIDAAAVEKARAFLQETGATDTMDALLGPLMQQMGQVIEAANPGQGGRIAQVMEELFVPEMRRRLPEFTEVIAILYTRHFSAGEIDELRDFYRTPLGRKLIEKQKVLALEGNRLGLVWGARAAAEALQRILPELERRGLRAPKI